MNNKLIEDLPVHFFTIVLNGKPFIEYHINVFKNLPFKWHWHVIEGVADLKGDTAWSLQNGARISDELHKNGLSKDGTSEYLDALQKEYPDEVTIYRKGKGQFWNGKIEMVNAPLPKINEECILWEIDSDELWTEEQFIKGRQLYLNNPDKTASYYFCYFFVGENKFITSVNTYGNHTDFEWLRSWRFLPGDKWETHEPPRLCRQDSNGEWIDIGKINPFTHAVTQYHKLVFQHFAYVTEEQLRFKEHYYGYKNAVEQWEKLQSQTKFPLLLKNYFEWVKDETVVDDSRKFGIIPLAYTQNDNWLFNFFKPAENKINKILFLRTDSIGDCVLASSMLEPIKKKYPDAELVVCCQHFIKPLFENSPFVDNIIPFNRNEIQNNELYRKKFIEELKVESFDLLLNSVYSSDTITDFISVNCGAKENICFYGDSYNIDENSFFINKQFYSKVVHTENRLNELQYYQSLLNELNIPSDNLEVKVWESENSEKFADDFFKENGLEQETTIAFFPFAQHFHKEYSNYGEVIKAFPKFKFLTFGGKEKEKRDELKDWSVNDNFINMVGKTGLSEMISLIKRCCLYIGADSAGVHIANALKIPNVVVLGGGHFGRFLPYSNLTSVVCEPMECYGCGWNCSFETVRCVQNVKPQNLIRVVNENLNSVQNNQRIFVQTEDDNYLKILDRFIKLENYEIIKCEEVMDNLLIEEAIESNDFTKAIQLLQEVVDKNPADTDALNNLAVVLLMLGETDSAVRALNLVLKIEPENEIAKENLAVIAK